MSDTCWLIDLKDKNRSPVMHGLQMPAEYCHLPNNLIDTR
jgi:hypothetical protein